MRLVKVILIALLIGGAIAAGLMYLGKANFDRSEYGHVR